MGKEDVALDEQITKISNERDELAERYEMLQRSMAQTDDEEKKVLRVKMIQKEGLDIFQPAFLFDEGSTVSWIPCGRKLTCSFPGIKFFYGPDSWYGQDVSVLEMDGQFDKLEELIYVESHLSSTSAKFYGEITQNMLKNSSFPGSNNGTGLFQTLIGLKVREV